MASVATSDLEAAIRASDALSPLAHVAATDVTGGGACGAKFEVVVVSARVEGVGLLDRQRLVHAALGPLMGRLHALSMKVMTPVQFEQRRKAEAALAGAAAGAESAAAVAREATSAAGVAVDKATASIAEAVAALR
jgi:acid stress-induced BolA-like protein IbaG/YrbA